MTANCEECDKPFVVTDRHYKLIIHDRAIYCDTCDAIIKNDVRVVKKEGMPLVDESVDPCVGIMGHC